MGRCEVLRTCVQYINAKQMGLQLPPQNYPTLLAASGIVPLTILQSLSKKYIEEINGADSIGKLALKKVLTLVEEEGLFANRLDWRHQFPLHVKVTPLECFRFHLDQIPE